ncbi:tyr_phosphatase_2 domain-containing protein [Haematococcus lacustris]|uniref:Tyr_phosphatase_2 domain-containing protein n=1 Tax=Haematococcus lacustris TaxID=44745 RepID=A0A699ZRV9_HAELA|nr:tyr_phosphatase_2 domain-containing protein [Haematococcus lacustris]
MIVDLTNSHRYYNFANEFPDAERMQLAYVKVPCRGKGQTPTPESVNEVVYEMYRLLSYYQDSVVLMHCTHGFNRTGGGGCAIRKGGQTSRRGAIVQRRTGKVRLLAGRLHDRERHGAHGSRGRHGSGPLPQTLC